MSLAKSTPESNQPTEQFERVVILRSGHGRSDGAFTTACSFIVSSTGANLLTGRHITKRAARALTRNAEAHERGQVVRQFPARPRPTSPTNTHNRRAA